MTVFPQTSTRHPAGFFRLCGEYGVTAVSAGEKVLLHPTVQERSHPVAPEGGMSYAFRVPDICDPDHGFSLHQQPSSLGKSAWIGDTPKWNRVSPAT
jgi:hypothetical protein